MTVVRSLTTNLDFNVDFKTLNNFSTLLSRFNLKFALGGFAAGTFARQVVSAINGVSNLILETDQLSRVTGVAFTDITNLSKAAEKLGNIDAGGFNTVIRNLSKDILDAQTGMGRLFEISRGTLGANGLNIFGSDGRVADVLTVLESVVEAINKIEDQQQRIRAFAEVLGGGDLNFGERLDVIFKDGYQAFKAIADSFTPLSKTLEEGREFANEYRTSLSEISQKFNNTIEKFVVTFTPVILLLIKGLDLFVESLATYADIVSKITNAVSTPSDTNPLTVFGRGLMPDLDDVWSPVEQNSVVTPVNVENVFQVQLSPGTPEEQGRQIFDAATSAFTNWWETQAQQIMNNNPQVE